MATFINIPLPATVRTSGSKYDFAALEVNGAGLVETDVVQSSKVAARLQSALAATKKRNPELASRTFKIRTFMHEGSAAVGVWRTA